MFFNKKNRVIDREIMNQVLSKNDDKNFIITIKAEKENQIFSEFNYNNKDTLSTELCDYISKNAKHAPKNKEILLNIYTKLNINSSEVTSAIKSHYKREYFENKENLSKTTFTAAVSLIFGILSLALIIVFHTITNNFYLTTVTEIMAWVFIWEAVDKFFYERLQIKQKCLTIQSLYIARVKIIKK